MRALFFHKKLKYIRDYPLPQRGEGEALIRVLKAGICNTDIEITRGYMPFKGVLGHEFVGVVEEAEDRAWIGKRVVGGINCTCGHCEYCGKGLGNHCPNRKVLGMLGKDGAFADYITLPLSNLHEVPANVTNPQAVFVEPIAAAFRVLEQVDIGPKDEVVVLGDGKLGLLMAQVIAGTGCQPTVIGRHPQKLELLARKKIRTMLSDEGLHQMFDLCIDCTGSPMGLEAAMGLVRPLGKIVLKSTFVGGGRLNLSHLVVNEVVLLGSRCGPFPRAIKALEEGTIDVDPMITETFDLEMARKAFNLATKRGVLKVLLNMT